MALQAEIEEAAKAMVRLGQEHRAAGKPMPNRLEEAKAALIAAEAVREKFMGRLFGPENII